MNPRKLLKKALAGPENLAFRDLLTLARAFGFQLIRTSGSHHILGHPDIPEQLNFQDVGGKAKPYPIPTIPEGRRAERPGNRGTVELLSY